MIESLERHRIGSGKVRELYDLGSDGLLLVASDRISAFDVVMPDPIPDKGRVLTGMTLFWLGRTSAIAPNHLRGAWPGELPEEPDWTSGFDIARDVDLLIHDSQFGCHQYHRHVGWGHCTLDHALGFAAMTGARRLLTFHHDPRHDDDALDTLLAEACARQSPLFEVIPGREGMLLELAR